jgi:membrane-associated phospholipid phosphatase
MVTRKTRKRWLSTATVVIMLFCVLSMGLGYSQADSGEYKLNKEFFIRFGRDFKGVLGSPCHWGKKDVLTVAAISGVGLLLYSFDEDINAWVQGKRTPSSDDISSVFSYVGNGGVLLGLAGVIYAVGAIDHEDSWRKTALLSVESLVTASILVWGTKAIVGRARPDTDESGHTFDTFTLDSGYQSFPSGHAAGAFAVATTIAEQSTVLALDIIAYSLATLVALSRIHDNQHWASDVLIGSALGYFIGKKISDLNRPGAKKTVSLGFQFSRGRQALTLSIRF